MKQSIKYLILLLALLVLIPLAVFGYNYLSENYNPTEASTSESSEGELSSQSNATTAVTPDADTNTAADFTVTDMSGNEVKLSDYFGKPVVINFWASWCGPCKSELASFDDAHKKYGDSVEFLMVNLTDGFNETVDGVKDFISDSGYSFPVYFDTMSNGAYAYNVSSIPLSVFIDKSGNVSKTYLGAMSEATLEEYIGYINA